MTSNEGRSAGRALWFLGFFVALWGVVGFVMERGEGETGFFYGPDYLVRTVMEESPAEAAGVQLGDRVVSIDGTPVEDLPMQSRWRRRPIGATAEVALQRGGEALSIEVVFEEIPVERRVRSVRALIVNLAFIGFGLWAYLSVGTPLAFLLAGICLTRAMASFPGPHLGPRFEGIGASLQAMAIVAFSFLLLRLFLELPKPRRIVQSGTIQKVLWSGLLFTGLLCLAEVALHPALYMILGYILMALILPVYLLLLVLVPWSWVKATAAERRETGLSLMLLGFLVGLGPGILRLAIESTFGLTLPGSDFIPLVEVAIPFFLALGVRRHAENLGAPPGRSDPVDGEEFLQPV